MYAVGAARTTSTAAPDVADLSGPDLWGPDLSGPDLWGPDLWGPPSQSGLMRTFRTCRMEAVSAVR